MSRAARCVGILPLTARLAAWQRDLLHRPDLVGAWLDEFGSPLNLLDPAPMADNAGDLARAAMQRGVDLQIHLARKANKALGFVDEAERLGLGIDLAGERELTQVLDRGVPGARLIMTAAVKPPSLLRRCVASGTTIAIDNADELSRLAGIVGAEPGTTARVALRLAPDLGPGRLQTRFGAGIHEALVMAGAHRATGIVITGVHFHLDGYAASDRVAAIAQSLELVDALRAGGHEPGFVDIGGGIPMSYLDSAGQWERFWAAHRDAMLGNRDPLTFEGHGLGLVAHAGALAGRPATYPYHQEPVRGAWLGEVLDAAIGGDSVAEALSGRGLQLRCEPGRALLDGCGMTAARVMHRKQRRDGTWLIGVEMNRTQCRSTSEDFLVDPLLLRPAAAGDPTAAIEGYLVGAYCIERELLTWRRLVFPDGVAVGDVVVFPNTAGYLMHSLESSSHQMPLARNVLVRAGGPPLPDPIDGM